LKLIDKLTAMTRKWSSVNLALSRFKITKIQEKAQVKVEIA
jgi:hypothetical protein